MLKQSAKPSKAFWLSGNAQALHFRLKPLTRFLSPLTFSEGLSSPRPALRRSRRPNWLRPWSRLMVCAASRVAIPGRRKMFRPGRPQARQRPSGKQAFQYHPNFRLTGPSEKSADRRHRPNRHRKAGPTAAASGGDAFPQAERRTAQGLELGKLRTHGRAVVAGHPEGGAETAVIRKMLAVEETQPVKTGRPTIALAKLVELVDSSRPRIEAIEASIVAVWKSPSA